MLEPNSTPQENLAGLEWLVERRSTNQRSALRLYRLIIENKEKFSRNQWRRSAAQKLLGVTFSLWRAVFLSDIKQAKGSMLGDVEGFLLELIQNNAINYPQDRKNRDWTFRYYLQNATDRLTRLYSDFDKKKFPFELPGSSKGQSPQERWDDHQRSLDSALSSFEAMLHGTSQRLKVVQVKPASGTKSKTK